tara:strand:- start:70955 stop:71122 length:168 start_codon:yes stop_codon:yes gene_type:complete
VKAIPELILKVISNEKLILSNENFGKNLNSFFCQYFRYSWVLIVYILFKNPFLLC